MFGGHRSGAYVPILFRFQIEVNLSILWEDADESPTQVAARAEILAITADILNQIEFWSQADKLRTANMDASN